MSVRWDEVVTQGSFPSPRAGPTTVPPAQATTPDGPFPVRVRLFGMLVGPEVKNPIVLRFDPGCTLRDVIQELGRWGGPELLRKVLSEKGESLNTCRLFLDGEPVHDMATVISPRVSTGAMVEIILFREIEGG